MCESHVLITRWPTDPSAIAGVHGSAKQQVDEVRVAVVECSEPTASPISGARSLDPGHPRLTVATTTTDLSGNYIFSDLAAGEYRVREVLQSGYGQSFPVGNAARLVTVQGNDELSGVNFGNAVAPVATNDMRVMLERQTLIVSAPGVLSNDADADPDDLFAAGACILSGTMSRKCQPRRRWIVRLYAAARLPSHRHVRLPGQRRRDLVRHRYGVDRLEPGVERSTFRGTNVPLGLRDFKTITSSFDLCPPAKATRSRT